MSTRRPRIKVSANLGPKRKLCNENSSIEKNPKPTENIEEKDDTSIVSTAVITKEQTKEQLSNDLISENSDTKITNPFKCPQILNAQKQNPILSSSFESDKSEKIEEEIIQQDLQRFSNGPQSPLKHRQRIRPTPCFGLRRNSIQGNSSDLEDEPKRQRYLSTSSTHSSSGVQKINPILQNRIRTESSCSGLSDYNVTKDYNIKSRKCIGSEENQRIALAKREFQTRFNGKTPEKSSLKMFDLIYYNPVTNPMKNNDIIPEKLDGSRRSSIASQAPQASSSIPPPSAPLSVHEEDKTEQNVDDIPSQEKETFMPVPQLKLGPNGEMILDEKSLVIETTADKDARNTLASSNVIYMDEYSGNNGFYRRQKRSKLWSAEETIKFYRCLHTVGTDFSLMLTLFPNRTRRDLKLKFNKEERYNLNLINKALLFPKTFNIDDLKTELEREEKESLEKQKKWEELKKKNIQKSKETTKPSSYVLSRSCRTLKDGDLVYENEDFISKKKKKSRKKLQETRTDIIDDDNVFNDEDLKLVNENDIKTNIPESMELSNEIDNKKHDFNLNTLLTELANGSLVIVSSEDPDQSEAIINEIYIMCKETGQLSEKPLDLPEEIINCIIDSCS